MVRLPPISKRTDTLITYTPLFGSPAGRRLGARPCAALRAVAGLDRPGAGARAPRPTAARNPRAADRPRPEADHQPAPLEAARRAGRVRLSPGLALAPAPRGVPCARPLLCADRQRRRSEQRRQRRPGGRSLTPPLGPAAL